MTGKTRARLGRQKRADGRLGSAERTEDLFCIKEHAGESFLLVRDAQQARESVASWQQWQQWQQSDCGSSVTKFDPPSERHCQEYYAWKDKSTRSSSEAGSAMTLATGGACRRFRACERHQSEPRDGSNGAKDSGRARSVRKGCSRGFAVQPIREAVRRLSGKLG
jgi:hypothetical protein